MAECTGVAVRVAGWSRRKMSGRRSSRVMTPWVARSTAAALTGEIEPP